MGVTEKTAADRAVEVFVRPERAVWYLLPA